MLLNDCQNFSQVPAQFATVLRNFEIVVISFVNTENPQKFYRKD